MDAIKVMEIIQPELRKRWVVPPAGFGGPVQEGECRKIGRDRARSRRTKQFKAFPPKPIPNLNRFQIPDRAKDEADVQAYALRQIDSVTPVLAARTAAKEARVTFSISAQAMGIAIPDLTAATVA